MANTKTTITISGKEYTIVSEDSKEHVHRVAEYLDEQMYDLEKRYVGLNAQMRTTLVALNLADDLLKTKDELASIREEVEEMRRAMRDIEIRRHEESEVAEHTAEIAYPKFSNVM